jgi:hypothetical protein
MRDRLASRFGIHLLPADKRRRRLETWFAQGITRIIWVPWDASTGVRMVHHEWIRILCSAK